MPKQCPECAIAQFDGHHHGRRTGCADCDIRALATGPKAAREAAFDHFERWLGHGAADELRRLVTEEWERVKAQRGIHR